MRVPVAWAAACLLLAVSVDAAAARSFREVLSVRIEGYVGKQPADAPVEESWTVSLKGESYQLHVTKLQVLTGSVAYYDIFTQLKPYHPTLTIAGEDADLDEFATAPAGEKIEVMGFLQFAGGARYLMVSSVEALGEATPTPGGAAYPE
jgi:hypothetical protein